MSDHGSSVTLIFYSLDDNWYTGTEPFLNLVAAAAQRSSFTHIEIAIGESAGRNGEMCNVLRVFNDSTGVELTQRTGKNPQYSYVQLGCSSRAVAAMLNFARRQVGKPFSSVGMVRSMVYPRITDETSFFCAELVAACLKKGGLMSSDSNPGEATPRSLFEMYRRSGAVVGNPCTLRQQFGQSSLQPLARRSTPAMAPQRALTLAPARAVARSASPPRATFKVVQPRRHDDRTVNSMSITLKSLQF